MSSCDNRSAKSNNPQSFIMIFLMLFSSFAVYVVQDMAVVPTILDDNNGVMYDGDFNDAEMVKNINLGSSSSSPVHMVAVGNTLYFQASDGTNGVELWKSDGTTAGTMMVKDIYSGTSGGYPEQLTAVGNTLYFQATDGSNGFELWKSDGTSSGTVMVKDINPNLSGSYPSELTAVGNSLVFRANDGSNGIELWKSNGTSAGTVMVKDINSVTGGSGDSNPGDLTLLNGTLYFAADDGTNGAELWKSDGTANGTVMVRDINNGSSDGFPHNFKVMGSALYFQADDGINEYELWKSDGTASGTMMIKDIYSGSSGSSPSQFTVIGSTIYFRANGYNTGSGLSGKELWKSDGTTSGTVMVKDINNGSGDSGPTGFIVINNILYFKATDGTNGLELWKSDGTSTGTVMVKDIYSGSSSSNPAYPTVVGNTLYFTAFDGTGANGLELWKSDGTSSGTVMVKDINSGITSSNPLHLTAVGSSLFFSADDGTNGRELWKATTTSTSSVEVNGNIFWQESSERLNANWNANNMSTSTTYDYDWNVYYFDNNTYTLVQAFNGSFNPTATSHTGGTHHWPINNTNIIRGQTYCVEVTFYLSTIALDNDVSCITIPNGGEVEIDSYIEFDNAQEKLIYGWQAYNLTAGTEYLVDWSLYYSSNGSDIHNGIGDSVIPTSNQTSFLTAMFLTSDDITRGLEYCVDSQISNSQNTPLDADHVVCVTIPNGSTGGGDDDVEIGAQLIFDVENSNLDLGWDANNLTTTNTYSVNWSLYYSNNGTEIEGNTQANFSPPSTEYSNSFSSYPLSNAWISRGLTYCLDISIFDSQWASLSSDTKCATIPNGSNGGGGGTWAISTVDSGTSVGEYTSLALDSNGDVHISYFDTSADDLKYATDSSGSWVSTAVDYSASALGEYNSLAVHSNGDVHISYYDSGNQDLKYATDSSGSWSWSAIDTGGDVGKHTSLAVDSNGGVHIAYYDLTSGALRYAHKPVDQWAISTIDATGDTGRYTSLGIDSSDNVHISYYDVSNFDLMYATDSTGSWVTTRVDDVNNVGKFTSLAVDSNDDVHISYFDETNTDLRYATDSSDSWVTSVVDTDPIEATGYFSSLGVDSNDDVHISYFDQTSENLNYATNSDGSWATSIVDSGGATGRFTSLGVDSNNDVHISYYDSTNTNLKYATTSTSGGSSGGSDGDNDGVVDSLDNCPDGESAWTSDPLTTDYDEDGCRDATEDDDDDNDGIDDGADSCYQGRTGWWSWDDDPVVDFDHDGCRDSDEDDDDDADGRNDTSDTCLLTRLGAVVDTEGCESSFPDDDGDGVSNSYDDCPNTPAGTNVDNFNGCDDNPDYWGVDGNSLAQMFPQAALDYVANSCDGPIDSLCAQAFGNWCETNSNVPGCEVIESLCEDDEDFIISDHATNPSLAETDDLITLQLTQTSEDLDWANLNIVITGDDGTQYQCTPLGVGSDCLILQFNSDDTRWEEGETIHLQEDSQAICEDSQCTLKLKITDSRDGKTLALARWTDNEEPASSEDIPEQWLNPLCLAMGVDTSGGDGDVDGAGDGTGAENETEDESNEWWTDIPVAGQVIEQIQTKYGKAISAAVFGLGVIGYGYRAITLRSEMVMKKRMKKFEKRIDAARTSSSLRRVQMDIEKADEKKLLPTGGFGDLMSMIELRAEDLGLAEFLPDEKLVAGGTGISDDDFREGMDAMRDAQEDMLSVADQLRQQRSQREKTRVAKAPKPNKDLVSMKDMATGGGISLPSYHPKDLNRDGKVDEEDERLWAAMSEEERINRSASPFEADGMTAQILAFAKLPSSSKSPCSCGSRKQYRKCHMNKEKCPCGSGKRFVSCCAEKRGFK